MITNPSIIMSGFTKRYLLFLFIVYGTATAQLNTENLVQLSEKDGLTSETVNRVIADRKGYLWIGTPNGLSRYDGYSFKQFFSNPTDSSAIQGMLIYALMGDSQNRIWAGTNPIFLEVFDPIRKSFKSYEYNSVIDPSLRNNVLYGYSIRSIIEDTNHRIFFDVHSNEDKSWLLYLDPADDKIKIFKGPDGKPFRDVYWIKKDTSGKIWLLSGTGIYYINEKDELRPFHLLDTVLYQKSEYPTDLVFTKDNHLFVVTTNATLIDLDRATGTYELWVNEVFQKDTGKLGNYCIMTPDRSENMWIGSNAGIFYFDRKSKKFSAFNKGENKEFEKVNVSSMAMDDFGNLWIGTANKGLLRYEKRPDFISLKSNSNEKNALTGWVGQIAEISDGKIWLRNDNGINMLDITQKEMQLFPNHLLPENYFMSTFWENGNKIYLSSYGGSQLQYSLKDGSIKKVIFPDFPESLAIRVFKKDTQGNEWYGTDDGLYRKEKNKQGYKHYGLLGLPGTDGRNKFINGILESQNNGLWLQTDNGLFMYRYDTDAVERHAFQDYAGDPLITQDVNALYEDPDGILWVGLWQGGLVKYDPGIKTIKNYKLEDGLPSMSVQGILGDENNGALWLSTFNGLSRFDKKAEIFNNYSVMDGIQGSQFSDGAFLKTTEGLFIFGGSNGITFFNPNDIEINNDPPKVFLTDFKLFNKSVLPGEDSVLKKPIDQTKQIVLTYDQNNLSIQYVGLHYSNPLKNEYAYQLENYDDTWRRVGGQNEAFYSNLSPGRYVFKAKAANDKGVWSDESIVLEIIIHPPWWRTVWAYLFYSLLLLLSAFIIHKYMKNRTIRIEREKSKDRELKQAKEIEKAYSELKSTQAQLIQSEKMASLGELTAGIAHEIQNPLNFVNNFSEVSSELVDEMNEELGKGNIEDAKEISADLKQNLEKITHHGKRAGEIVKGMLQHSRTSSGQKELTDINALAEEYLRLAYHGLRAKDKSFNAKMKTDLDSALSKIEVVPQDMGRVILNLITNAFYAGNEKAKQKISGYEPTISVSTKKVGDRVQISVKDNGNGIPDHIKEKIFQPFFTTKPAGQGTGLGLSLSYDIVKAHGGELSLVTKEGEGSEFIIKLPVT